MKKCCDNCARLTKTPDGFYCPIKQKMVTILYRYNACQRFKGANKYDRD